jgi:hypothetical protein
MTRGDETATYVYAVVASPAAPDLAAAPAGLPATAAPRALALAPGTWLVVADAPLASYGSDALERGMAELSWVSDRAIAHEAMVEHLAAAGTVVPMKLFTLFSSDERAVAEMGARRATLERVLSRISGCAEWGVRVLWHEARARQARPPQASEGAALSGRAFLLRKKQLQDGVRELLLAAREESTRLLGELDGLARASRKRAPLDDETGARLLLDAAFLVPAGQNAEFEAAVRRGAERLDAAACELILTGPWPAYNFADSGSDPGSDS